MDRLLEAGYRRQIADNPDQLQAIHSLAVLLGSRGEFEASVQLFQRALRLSPNDPHLHNDLGVTLERAGELARASQSFRESLRLKADSYEVWTNLANTLLHSGDVAGAQEACERALRIRDDYPPALNLLGSVLVDLGEPQEALEPYRRAIALWPNHPEMHTNYAMALLQCGDFETGWKEYEWRRKLPWPVLQRKGRAWDGSDPAGKTLFLYGEGGIGNVIQFARYVLLLHERGASVIVECQSDLVPLLATMPGVAAVIRRGQSPPPYDVHCPLASLPAVLGTNLDTVPATAPYIYVSAAATERWGPIVHRVSGMRIGVCWRSGQSPRDPRNRSLDPLHLLPLSNLPGISLINLQFGDVPPPELGLHMLPGLEPRSMQFLDAAAVISHLDLVISCDTSIAHLAGALGIPVWVMLTHVSSWRWMVDRDDSPWYPTMRLYRQEQTNDWASCVQRIAEALGSLNRRVE